MSNISFILFTRNEEKRISYAIKNFIQYGDVFVLDGGSTDRTREITENLGAKFIERPHQDIPFVENKENFALIKQIIKTDWVYWGYVDNFVPQPLVEEFVRIAREDKYKRVFVPMHTYLWGNTEHIAQTSQFAPIFHKDYMDFSNNRIHAMGKFSGKEEQILTLPNKDAYTIRHFSTYNEAKFIMGLFRYADEEAKGKYAEGKRYSTIRMLAAMIRYCWIFRRSIRLGGLGAIIMLNYAFSRLMTYSRLYEIEHEITLESIEEAYSIEKEKLLKTYAGQ